VTAAPGEITLTLPRDRRYHPVADLVLGGLAARLDLTLEQFDDLKLALAELLERPLEEGGTVTVVFRVEDSAIHAAVGPFLGAGLRAELDRDLGEEIGLRRLLETVVDQIELVDRDGGNWVELTKTLTGRP
jgi:hypothetical protein